MEESEPLEPPEDAAEESPEEPIAFATRDLTSPPSRGGRFSVFLLIVAIGGGIYFFARSKRIPSSATPGPTAPGPDVTATVSSPFEGTSSSALPGRPVPGPSTSELPAEPSARATAAAPPPIPESHGSSMVSSDWTGPAAAYMIHFSSFQKRENAERDAARLGKLMGRPLHVIAVNLGKDGMWFRVMLGDFSSREEAQAFREGLAANGTAGMGLVYRVSAPQAE
jgi:cell division protein FtsN